MGGQSVSAVPYTVDVEAAKTMKQEDLFAKLESSASGLSAAEAGKRLTQCGPNSLEEKKRDPLLEIFKYFWGPIPWMIEAAALLSLIARDFNDFYIILFMLVFNGLIGFWEEHKANNALDALKKGLALQARVLRDGAWSEIEASQVVPGDVIRIRLGDVIPADGILIDGEYLSVDQAALTGESLPVGKKVGDSVYSGSIARQGEMIAVVAATGGSTFFGRTAQLVAGAGNVSHFQQAVMRIGNFLIVMCVGLCLILVTVCLYRDHLAHGDVHLAEVLRLVKFVLILTIASIPIAMPAVLSVTMALGALAMSKKKAIVARLQAIEEMAGVDILCSDKTGTLTKNQLTLDRPALFAAKDDGECILAGALASKAEDNDAIDLAVIGGLKDASVLKSWTQLKFVPFDPVGKRTCATVKSPDGSVERVTKGAPQVIAGMCAMSDADREKAAEQVKTFASSGYRALGVARAEGESGGDWTFLGIIPLFDPPRDDSAETIAQAKAHGLEVKMVTGDDIAIASEISGRLGMGTHIQAATDLFGDQSPDHLSARTAECIEKADGFGRVFPEHKYGIVKALQSRGHIVAMTGDGVNDAPALKQADAGIAVSGATDAARAAAALILTAPGLGVIISAIEVARQIFERMMSYTTYRIAMTMDVMIFVVLSMLVFPTVPGTAQNFAPLTAAMIIILALLDDIPIMTIAYDRTRVDPKPVRWRMGRILTVSGVLGALSVVQTFGLLFVGMHFLRRELFGVTIDPTHLQTMVFLQLVVGGHLMLFVTRTAGSILKPPYPAPVLFWALVGTQVFAALMCGFGWLVPALPWTLIGLVWCYNLVWMLIQDAVKMIASRLYDHRAGFQAEFLARLGKALRSRAVN